MLSWVQFVLSEFQCNYTDSGSLSIFVEPNSLITHSSASKLHPASNLLSTDVSKKKWLCGAGERSCSVVLGVSRAVKVSSVTIGAHLCALVEVLVGRSEAPDEPFKVLVASSVFLNPMESRKADTRTCDRVRSFHKDVLCEAHTQPWDRFRIVCSQPYNRHCQFGLSFVQMTSCDEVMLPMLESPSDEEDVFQPGDMFKMHLSSQQQNTSCQIREATRMALSEKPQSPALVKAPVCVKRKRSTSPHKQKQHDNEVTPHQSIRTPATQHKADDKEKKVAKASTSRHKAEIRKVLQNIVFVLSGYENPERSQLRDCALAMGATYKHAWSAQCTHLICAFPNTPKLRSVRALSSDAAICTGDWLRACEAAQRKLPWTWYATEPHRKVTPSDDHVDDAQYATCAASDNDDTPEEADDTLSNTTMEHMSPNSSQDSDITFVRDERVKGTYVINDDDDEIACNDDADADQGNTTDEDVSVEGVCDVAHSLPNFLDGYTVHIGEDVCEAGFERSTLARYVVAYGGQLIQELPMEYDKNLLILCTRTGQKAVGHPIRPDWLWHCHAHGAFQHYDTYLIT